MTINNTTIANMLNPVANATVSSNPFVYQFNTVNPTTSDIQYPIQKNWLNTDLESFWFLQNFTTSQSILSATWIKYGSINIVEALKGNDLVLVYPEITPPVNFINVVGVNNIETRGDNATHTLTIFDNGQVINYTNVTHAMSPYTVLTTDYYISVDCSAGVVQLNFQNSPTFKQMWIIKDRTGNASVSNITLTTPGGTVTFDGLTTYTMNSNYQSVNVVANAAITYEVW